MTNTIEGEYKSISKASKATSKASKASKATSKASKATSKASKASNASKASKASKATSKATSKASKATSKASKASKASSKSYNEWLDKDISETNIKLNKSELGNIYIKVYGSNKIENTKHTNKLGKKNFINGIKKLSKTSKIINFMTKKRL